MSQTEIQSLAARLGGLAELSQQTKREAAQSRFHFKGLAESKSLEVWLRDVGCDARDELYEALLAHIAQLEQSQAKGRSCARRRMREGGMCGCG